MNWWPIIENLRDFLLVQPEFADITVLAGGTDEHTYPRIEILWDNEGGLESLKPKKGNITLWIDCWAENDGDQSSAYGLLYNLQRAFFDLLAGWPAFAVGNLGLALNVKIGRIISDGGTSRPIAGSRTTLEIEWKGGKNYGYSES